MMDFVIGRHVLDGKIGIEISEQEYLEVKRAHAIVFFAMRSEEKFNLVISNYKEYETEIFRCTFERSLHHDWDWSGFHEDMDAINRRLLNLLAGGRLYIQHLLHDTSSILDSSNTELQTLSEIFGAEYESSLGYRVGEALRNYIQHRGFPITGLSFPNKRVENSNDSAIRAQIRPFLTTERLRQDGRFKKSVLSELEEIGPELNVTVFMRQYVQSISKIHHAF